MLDICLVYTRYIDVTYFDSLLCEPGKHLKQAVPDPTLPRVNQSPGGDGAHFSGLNKLFFWVLGFEGIGVMACFANAVELARSIRKGSNLADLSFHALPVYKAHLRVLKLDILFLFHGHQR